MQRHFIRSRSGAIVLSVCLIPCVLELCSQRAAAQRSRGDGGSRSSGSSSSRSGSSSSSSSRGSSGSGRSSGSSSSSSSGSSRSGGSGRSEGGSRSSSNRSGGNSSGSSNSGSSGSSGEDRTSSYGRPSTRTKDRDRGNRTTNDNGASRARRDRSSDTGAGTIVNNRGGGRTNNGEGISNRGDDPGDPDRSRNHRRRGFNRHRDGNRDEWCRREYEWGRAYYVSRPYVYSNYGNYQYSSSAYDNGYKDGVFTGSNDARRGQSYDPERSHFYKHAGGGFLSIFGHPDTFSTAYRDGFRRGYEEGYRNWQTYFIGDRFQR